MKAKIRKCHSCKTKQEISVMRIYDKLYAICDTPECKATYGLWKVRKKKAKEDKEFRAETRRMKAANPVKKDLVFSIQRNIFNPWVRLRDFDLPCISCQKFEHELPPPPPPGGIWQAGHYKSRGARKDVCFNPDNCHKQCYWCNNGASQSDVKNETVGALYRINLIKKIGLPRVEAVEVVVTHKYTVDELQGIKAEYAGKLKELKRLVSDE